ncbi:calcium-binding protein [Streptomyces sp. NPDC020965]|uniref:calcium-binding protein n=1 Tax=Streptomyces sp. NPDC020965 TaxID=3365105 RepID=UPI0037B3F513
MRIRASVAVVTGTLALTALVVPAAQADDSYGNTTVSNVVINDGKPLVFGPTGKKTFTLTFTASDSSGISAADAYLWRGKNINAAADIMLANEIKGAKCGTGAKPTCKLTFTINPAEDLFNDDAGAWKTWVWALAKDVNFVEKDNAKSLTIKRASALTADATPEPVTAGKTITVSGALTRANWEHYGDGNTYTGYANQSVQLQFRKAGATSYTTVKTVKSGSKGKLTTTVKATTDGHYRYSFAGTTTTAPLNSTGDLVDVR